MSEVVPQDSWFNLIDTACEVVEETLLGMEDVGAAEPMYFMASTRQRFGRFRKEKYRVITVGSDGQEATFASGLDFETANYLCVFNPEFVSELLHHSQELNNIDAWTDYQVTHDGHIPRGYEAAVRRSACERNSWLEAGQPSVGGFDVSLLRHHCGGGL